MGFGSGIRDPASGNLFRIPDPGVKRHLSRIQIRNTAKKVGGQQIFLVLWIRIRIHGSEARIRGSGSVPTCHMARIHITEFFPSSFFAVVGSGIRDSGWIKVRIRDPSRIHNTVLCVGTVHNNDLPSLLGKISDTQLHPGDYVHQRYRETVCLLATSSN
jgi:hypothetical protein